MRPAIQSQVQGLLFAQQSFQFFNHQRFAPKAELAEVVEHFWLIDWQLKPGQSYMQQNLPHGNCHLVIDPQADSGLFGVQSQRFSYALANQRKVLGVKLSAGKTRALFDVELNKLKDTFVLPDDLPKVDLSQPEQAMQQLENYLLAKLKQITPEQQLAADICQWIKNQNELYKVEDIEQQFALSSRQLQRLMQKEVGISAKWLIERERIFACLPLLEQQQLDLTTLAQQLGYFDSAHFAKQFKKLVGLSASNYLAKL